MELEWEPDDGMKTGNDYRKLGGKMRAHKDHQNGGEALYLLGIKLVRKFWSTCMRPCIYVKVDHFEILGLSSLQKHNFCRKFLLLWL